MSVDDLLADLAHLGWLVNNAYQTTGARWRVNIRRPTPTGSWFTDWVIADTLEDALTECMSKLLDAEFVETPEATAIAAPQPTDLATALGLRSKAPIIKRRF